jgi:hypothetical protein
MVPPLSEGERTNFSTCFKEMSTTIFLRRLWKILRLTTSIRQPIMNVNNFGYKGLPRRGD